MKFTKPLLKISCLAILALAFIAPSATERAVVAAESPAVVAEQIDAQNGETTENAVETTSEEKAVAEEEGAGATATERVGFFSLFGFLWILALADAVASLVFAVKFFKAGRLFR